jgi:outer membrane protein TolC
MQTHRPTYLLAALAVVMAGCGSQQWSTAANSGTVQSNWIESFGDPALTALVIEAQSNNPSIAAAAANLDRSWALVRSAGAALMPDANLVGLASESGTTANSESSTSLILGARVSWEPDLWGRLRAGRRSAQANAQSVEADFRSAQSSLAAATARAYFTAIEARNQADIARDSVSILEGTLQIVNLSYENGHATARSGTRSARSSTGAASASAGRAALGITRAPTGPGCCGTPSRQRLQCYSAGAHCASADNRSDRYPRQCIRLIVGFTGSG